MTIDFLAGAQALKDEMVARRRDLHAHPEMGFAEYRTAGIIAEALTELGMEVQTGVGKTGVVGFLGGDRPGPTVMMRFDMDALPIEEANAVAYASQNPGVMHACGHDGHVTIGLAVAKLLHAQRQEINGTLKFVFQPAEEGLGGALAMVGDGVIDSPRQDVALGLHLWNEKPVGWVSAAAGPVMAGAELFEIKLTGSGGHGAAPYQTKDPVTAAAQIVTALQTVVSRNVDARHGAVISVTQIHGGDAFNVIPGVVTMGGTIRTFDLGVREIVLRRFEEIVHGVATAMQCEAEIRLQKATSAVINDEHVAERVRELATTMPRAFTHIRDDERTMGSEDYGELVGQAPSCYFFVGSADPARGLNYPHHHPRFDFDEQALVNGAALMAAMAARYVFEAA